MTPNKNAPTDGLEAILETHSALRTLSAIFDLNLLTEQFLSFSTLFGSSFRVLFHQVLVKWSINPPPRSHEVRTFITFLWESELSNCEVKRRKPWNPKTKQKNKKNKIKNICNRSNCELGRHCQPSLTRAFLRRKINTLKLQISTHHYSYIPILIQRPHFFSFVFLLWNATDHRQGLLNVCSLLFWLAFGRSLSSLNW